MNLDANSFLASIFVSALGFVAFVYGKRQSRAPQMVVGIALMTYPYFVSNGFLMLGIALALLGGLWLAVRQGW